MFYNKALSIFKQSLESILTPKFSWKFDALIRFQDGIESLPKSKKRGAYL
jgi:hypothetical protein